MKTKLFTNLLIVTLGLTIISCDNNYNSPLTDNSLHVFSVGENKKVVFSKGNLQYQPSTNTWRFAENQYDVITQENNNITNNTYTGWIDLFGWGTGSQPTKTSKEYADYASFNDWGGNNIDNYSSKTWRTLTITEWEYLLYERKQANMLHGLAKVNDINGLILIPDKYWTTVDSLTNGLIFNGVRFKPGFYDKLSKKFQQTSQTYSLDEWNKLEEIGAIFLPSGGYRIGVNVFYLENYGAYWTRDAYRHNSAKFLYFYTDKTGFGNNLKINGFSVRLVSDL
jgi:hypothetical protein